MAATSRPLSPTDPNGTADLHTHSAESDGLLAPAALVREAAARGLRALALTDHDTVGGLAEAAAEAASRGLELIPGVELATGGQNDAPEIHLLGYFVDPADPDLLAGLAGYARGREERMDRMIARLAEAGVRVDPAAVRRFAGPGTVGRPHLARALVEAGHATDLGDAFARFIGRGRPGYAARPKVTPEAGIALIRRAGGVSVVAHPAGLGDLDALLPPLVAAGLGGLEADYGEYDEATRAVLRAAAFAHGLIPTGGSDYHGPGVKAGRELGLPPIPLAIVERLRAASGAAAAARA